MTLRSPKQPTAATPRRRQLNQTPFVTSYAVLGWVSLLLALSTTAEGFSMPGEARPMRIPKQLSAGKILDSTHSAGLTAKLFDRRRGCKNGTERHAMDTRLQYRNGDGNDSQSRQSTGWWQSVFPTAPAEPTEQENVDEYLDFLSRRYHRLHDEEEAKQPPKKKKFSALNWLKGDNKEDCRVTMQQEEDALYVLGVAELASQRLLQKHHLVVDSPRLQPEQRQPLERTTTVIDAVIADPEPVVEENAIAASTRAAMLPSLLLASKSLLKSLKNRRKALIATEDRQMKRLVVFLVKNLFEAPKKLVSTLQAAYKLGGGRRTVAMTGAMLVTTIVLVRPLVESLIREGLMDA